MEKLPKQIMDRFSSIFSKTEINNLENIFSLKKRPVSFRVNSLKSNTQKISQSLESANIKYSLLDFPKGCFLLDKKHSESDIWNLDIYKNGEIYMQNISSQVPVHFFGDIGSSKLRILDACAAPGGKTSQLSAMYPDAEIYAFEPHKIRYEKMLHNFKKLGIDVIELSANNTSLNSLLQGEMKPQIIAINDEIRNIGKYICSPFILGGERIQDRGIAGEEYFDLILIDAPCSSEGSLSLHNTKFLESWDISHIKKNYKRQKYILSDVLPYLKNQGELVYSTCTIAPEENEAVVHFALCNYPELDLQKLDFQANKYINFSHSLKNFEKLIFKSEISEKALRFIPSEYSEGFFIAKFKKGAK